MIIIIRGCVCVCVYERERERETWHEDQFLKF